VFYFDLTDKVKKTDGELNVLGLQGGDRELCFISVIRLATSAYSNYIILCVSDCLTSPNPLISFSCVINTL